MRFRQLLLYTLAAGLLVVSFQNCGQPGALGLESQELNKVTSVDAGLTDVSDVQDPTDVSTGAKEVPRDRGDQSQCDDRDDSDTYDMVDADENGNVHGINVSCADLVKYNFSIVRSSDL